MQRYVVAEFVGVLLAAFLDAQGGQVDEQRLDVGMVAAMPVFGDVRFPLCLALPVVAGADVVDRRADVTDHEVGLRQTIVRDRALHERAVTAGDVSQRDFGP